MCAPWVHPETIGCPRAVLRCSRLKPLQALAGCFMHEVSGSAAVRHRCRLSLARVEQPHGPPSEGRAGLASSRGLLICAPLRGAVEERRAECECPADVAAVRTAEAQIVSSTTGGEARDPTSLGPGGAVGISPRPATPRRETLPSAIPELLACGTPVGRCRPKEARPAVEMASVLCVGRAVEQSSEDRWEGGHAAMTSLRSRPPFPLLRPGGLLPSLAGLAGAGLAHPPRARST